MKMCAAFLTLLLLAAPLALTATAAPEIRISADGIVRAPGSPLFFASDAFSQVTEAQRITPTGGVMVVPFPLMCPGVYVPQFSTGQGIWTALGDPILHPATGTVTFSHEFFSQAPVEYRLERRFAAAFEVVIANPGSSSLTGINSNLTANVSGAFVLEMNGTTDTVLPGGSTTLRVLFSPADAATHTATLRIASNAPGSPFLLLLDGKALPDPISFCGGGMFSPDPDPDAPPPGFSVYGLRITPPGPGTPVRISGKIAGGVPHAEVVLEFSRDLRSNTWNPLEFIPLDSKGQATFGEPVPLNVPGSTNFPRCFFRATPSE